MANYLKKYDGSYLTKKDGGKFILTTSYNLSKSVGAGSITPTGALLTALGDLILSTVNKVRMFISSPTNPFRVTRK